MENIAIFIDLDHTLIKPKSGETFPKDLDDWELITKTVERVWAMKKALNCKVLIVSNQAGIEYGFISESELGIKLKEVKAAINNYVRALKSFENNSRNYLESINVIDNIQYCKYKESYYRKPNSGMAYSLALEYQLNLSKSFMIGDLQSDLDFALNSGIGTYIDVKKLNSFTIADLDSVKFIEHSLRSK